MVRGSAGEPQPRTNQSSAFPIDFAGCLYNSLTLLCERVIILHHRPINIFNFFVLHWLPIQARVQFKLCTLMYGIQNSQGPAYLSDAVQSVASTSTRERLRSIGCYYEYELCDSQTAVQVWQACVLARWLRCLESISRNYSPSTDPNTFQELKKHFYSRSFLCMTVI